MLRLLGCPAGAWKREGHGSRGERVGETDERESLHSSGALRVHMQAVVEGRHAYADDITFQL